MLCFLRGMAFVPFLLVTWSSAAFIISYVVAVLSGHVNPFLPYISDTGTTPPESGIFGFMINFSAFLGLHLWHMQVPKLGVKSELQLLAYTTAMLDPSPMAGLHHSLRQRWILNRLSAARDHTHIVMDTSRVLNLLNHNGSSSFHRLLP